MASNDFGKRAAPCNCELASRDCHNHLQPGNTGYWIVIAEY